MCVREEQSDDAQDGFVGDVGLFGSVSTQLAQTAEMVGEILLGECNDIDQLLEHIKSRPGKMIRAGFLLCCGRLCGKIEKPHIETAAIIELLHTASLFHDDVIDKARNRRGRPSANILWGNECAVLLGDYLLAKTFVRASCLDESIRQPLANTAMRICKGELRQNIARRNKTQLSESEYLEIVGDKTAALFECSCRLGAILAGGSNGQVAGLGRFGFAAGTAFQISDDVLDIVGEQSGLGKTLGTDLQQNRLTLPFIHFRKNCTGTQKDRLAELTAATEDEEAKDSGTRKEIAELLGQTGSIDYSLSVVGDYCEQAVKFLDFPAAASIEEKNCLAEVVSFIRDRCC